MIIALLVAVILIGGFVYLLKSKKITPQREIADLEAKAGAEAKQIEDSLSKEVAEVEANIKTPIVNVVQKL